MPLEATVIWCEFENRFFFFFFVSRRSRINSLTSKYSLDTSSFQRNGDYAPTRFDAQRDAVNIVANAKTQVRLVSNLLLSLFIHLYVFSKILNPLLRCSNPPVAARLFPL
jgi:hypothetical protein